MGRDGDVFNQVLAEFESYVPVLVPLFLVFAVESRTRLRISYAVRVLPPLEKEPVEGDCEAQNGVSAEKTANIRALRSLARRVSRRGQIRKSVFSFMLIAILLFEQTVYWRGWLNLYKKHEGFIGSVDGSAESDSESESQSSFNYRWYYDSMLGQLEWPREYHVFTLLFPLVYFALAPLILLLGIRGRVALRGADDCAVVILGFRQPVPRRLVLRALVALLMVEFVMVFALVHQDPICIALLFASMVYFIVSGSVFRAAITIGSTVRVIVLLTVLGVILFWLRVSSSSFSYPIRLLHMVPLDSSSAWNWSGLIASAFACSPSLSIISLCYRMDHAFAQPEELLADEPVVVKVQCTPTELVVLGLRIPFCKPRTNSDASTCSSFPEGGRCGFRRYPRWPKTYFRSSLFAWLLTYALVAYFKVKGFIATDAESATLYAFFLFPPIWSVAIMLRAASKGRDELKKVWTYKEDWVGKGDKELGTASSAGDVGACKKGLVGEALVSEGPYIEAEDEKLDEGRVLVSEERHPESKEERSIPVSVEQFHEAKIVGGRRREVILLPDVFKGYYHPILHELVCICF